MKVRPRDIIRVYWEAARRYKVLLFFIVAAVVGASLIELVVPFYFRRFFDTLTADVPSRAVVHELVWVLVIILLFRTGSWLLTAGAKFANNTFQPSVIAALKEESFAYLIGHSHGFFVNAFGGALVQRIRRLARAFENFADRLYWDLLPLVLKLGLILVILWYVNQTVALVFTVWACIFLLLNYFFSRWRMKFITARAAKDSEVTGALADAITNHANIQLFGGFRFEVGIVKKVTGELRELMTRTWNQRAVSDVVFQGALTVIVEFFLFYYAIQYWQRGALTLGDFVLIQAFFFQLLDRLWDFGRIVRDIYESFADAEEMTYILQTPHAVRDIASAKPLTVTAGAVEFKNVHFSFHRTREVLRGINFTIKPGEKVALIGPSGAGKSTIVKVLLRLYDVLDGKILIDGQNIIRVTQESLRENFSLVPQDPILFHRSLLENIRYGRREATDVAVTLAAARAHCDEFIAELPDGYATYVGERGVRLSGGERQRVAIARAILKNAPILVLDEATSSLDSHSERLIQHALADLMRDKTAIVIAHRLSTIQQMDRIIVIDRGSIVEEGTHEGLIGTPGSLYQKLWKLQAGGFLGDLETTEEIV
ncbi:ABC transporter ATP-binding protein [Candidatus Uhrbacteria bacterium]|nr:ABC transporter ATP-binding protein [Candidatus Uhrbacteria bacterium]